MNARQKISLNIGKSIDIILNSLTPFEQDVLRAACEINPGQVRTYKWIARRIGRPNAQRAVGQALKKNPLPLLIPCHRVIAAAGKIGGYSLGVHVKKQLLDFEKELIAKRKE
ncbi:MAG: MGMT family protein [Candidatus Omnitrophica bacterium]|nr:MGMT family protein [Candidatus Omnitrophota bacterium]MBU4479064.1 MGMT family protein [Candidatus Omnitrophota bacterium]MCG2703093.1 MGMT family protein [Candidatus Omnitrophota bacterium]